MNENMPEMSIAINKYNADGSYAEVRAMPLSGINATTIEEVARIASKMLEVSIIDMARGE